MTPARSRLLLPLLIWASVSPSTRALSFQDLSLSAEAATAKDAEPAAANPLICGLPGSRLVFTLADATMQSCMATSSGGVDARCSSLCWCRSWASTPVASDSTLALCVPMNATTSCTSEGQSDCRAALEATAVSNSQATSTTAPPPAPASPISSSTDMQSINGDKAKEDDEEERRGTSGWVFVLVGFLCVAVTAAIAFVTNWYRNRPVSVSAPATVTHGDQHQQAGLPTWTELDAFDDKMPEALQSSTRPSHRGSIHLLQSGAGGTGGLMTHFDSNASMISGISGASYHDLDGTRLGHLNEAHALTETELSLSKDATERVFSPVGEDSASDTLSVVESSFMSNDSVDTIQTMPTQFRSDGRPFTQRVSSPLGEHHLHSHNHHPPHHDSSFISVASTTYLTNNDTFSSQITMPEIINDTFSSQITIPEIINDTFSSQITIPESDAGSVATTANMSASTSRLSTTSRLRETEF